MTPKSVPRFLRPVQRPVTPFIVALTVLLIVLVFGLLAAHTSEIDRVELPVDQWFNQHHSTVLTGAANTIVVIFEPVTGAALLVLVTIIVLLATRRVLVAVTYLIVTFGTLAGAQILKWLAQRDRPPLSALPNPPPADHTFSYPSGHTTIATVLIVSLVLLLPGAWKWMAGTVGAVIVLLVAVSRFYLGSHYPTDVIASILFGIAGITLLRIVVVNMILPPILRR